MKETAPSFYEFFAGGGMARKGLGNQWRCIFANEIDKKKSDTYRTNWGEPDVLKTADVRSLKVCDLSGQVDLAWASFPCQDLSLAGAGAGLQGDRSGTFWPFWRLMEALLREDRAPSLIAVENVVGTITSHGGKDFLAICEAYKDCGYRFGPLVVDAAHFVPQSRPRLFVIGVKKDLLATRGDLTSDGPDGTWHSKALIQAFRRLPDAARENWVWWNLSKPKTCKTRLIDIIEHDPSGVVWHTEAETKRLLSMMSDINREKVDKAKQLGHKVVGTVYRRTRKSEVGLKIQRAEIRFDGLSGCLRTPAGGSSRQIVLIVEGGRVQSRLMSPKETARLMGLPDTYKLPSRYNEAYHLTGDGVVVPAVRYLAQEILEPLIRGSRDSRRVAA